VLGVVGALGVCVLRWGGECIVLLGLGTGALWLIASTNSFAPSAWSACRCFSDGFMPVLCTHLHTQPATLCLSGLCCWLRVWRALDMPGAVIGCQAKRAEMLHFTCCGMLQSGSSAAEGQQPMSGHAGDDDEDAAWWKEWERDADGAVGGGAAAAATTPPSTMPGPEDAEQQLWTLPIQVGGLQHWHMHMHMQQEL
jgi:hypothetical protein